ncbi:MAG: AAA family ATPase [Deltaproteobacteria bacterium]|nr:AAA family ATPase [Deltaproteobacteria bacterium]
MAQYDINLREYWRILKKRKYIVIITAVLLCAFTTLFATIQAPTPLYTSFCSIKFEKETTLEGLYAKALSWYGDNDIQTQIAIIKGYPVLIEVAKTLRIIPKDTETDPLNLKPEINIKIEELQSKIAVIRQEYTNILDIKVTDSNPEFSKELAKTIALTYKQLHAEQQNKRTKEAIQYIGDQLETMQQKLQKAEEDLNQFSRKNQLVSIDMQSENILLRVNEIQDEIRKQSMDQRELKALSERIEDFIKNASATDINFYSTKADRQYETTTDNLVELLLKRDTLLEDFTDQHPEVIAINRKIMENARKMQMLLQIQVDRIDEIKTELTNELNKENRKINLLMEKRLEYERLKREAESLRDMTALLEQRNQEAQIREAERPEEVIIVKPAIKPTTPVNPPKTKTTGAMGLVIGVVLGLIFAFIIETFDTSLGAIEDVEETLGAKVLGVIPQAEIKDILENLKIKFNEIDEHTVRKAIYLVSHFAPKTMIAESYRAIRTNIQFKEADAVKTIAVTSTSPQEGKTQVSINLALSMAQAGQKTLLVGSDLRKPMLAKAFGLEVIPGLTDILLGTYPWRDTVKTITDIIMGKMTMDEVMMTPGMDNLHIITSGTLPPNPAELIESKRLLEFIAEVKQEYDIIIFDSTPIISTADAAILGTKVDGVLIVYRVGSVSRGLLKRAASQLEQVKCNIIGVILNGMRPDISPDFQEFRYYQSYYGEGEKSYGNAKSKHLFSFFGKKAKNHDPLSNSSILPTSAKSLFPKGSEKKRSSMIIWFFIVLALICLAAGILWQNGIIDPPRLYHILIAKKVDESHQPVQKKQVKIPIEKSVEESMKKPILMK